MNLVVGPRALLTRLRTATWKHEPPESPSGLRVLLYHRVADDDRDALTLRSSRFRAQMAHLAAIGGRGVDLVTALDALYAGTSEPGVVAITFDDGFRDVENNALRILDEFGFSATVFVATDVVEGRARYAWADPGLEVVAWDDIRRLEAGGCLRFEPHSLTHPNLTRLDSATCAREISESKAAFEARVERRARAFCYPGGFVGHRERHLTELAGFDYGVSCEPGVNCSDTDPLMIRRVQIYSTDRVEDFDAKLRGSHDRPLAGRRFYRLVRHGATGPRVGPARPEPAVRASPPNHESSGLAEDFAYSIVIPTKDRPQLLPGALERIAAQILPPKLVVIVDASDASYEPGDEILSRFRQLGTELRVLKHPPSTSAQRNAGADSVETPLVMFLDDDVVIDETYVEALVEEWRRRGFSSLGGVLGSSLSYPTRPSFGERLYRSVFQLHALDPGAPRPTFRRSQKVRIALPSSVPILVPATGAGAVIFRADLVRKHRFDERFTGYVLGEDLDMSARLAKEAPILEIPRARFLHEKAPGERASPRRWWYRGRYESYFRLKRLEPSFVARCAFALSLLGEFLGALGSTLGERDLSHVKLYTRGVVESIGDIRAEHRRAKQ